MKIRYIEISQPIGSFYLTALEASVLAKIVDVKRRGLYPDAVQREESKKRVKEISEYCSDPDATFPTAIIISVYIDSSVRIDDSYIYFDENEVIGEVIDGQHRLAGLTSSDYLHAFQLPVVFMFNLEVSEKAYVFSIINSKQTRVNMSLIYDLFALSKSRSPYKTCHEIARSLNKDPQSPFYRRLKMLGKKEIGDELASISQGSFIKFTLELISIEPDKDTRLLKDNNTKLTDNNRCPLRKYFIEDRDDVILKILFNMFSALSRVFRNEWNEPDKYILSKSIGFGAIIKAFPKMYEMGNSMGDLSVGFFEEQFTKVRDNFKSEGKEFTSHYYGSNEQARTKIANDITKCLN